MSAPHEPMPEHGYCYTSPHRAPLCCRWCKTVLRIIKGNVRVCLTCDLPPNTGEPA